MAEKKKYNSILVSGRKDETLTYSKYIKDEESGESVKESLDKKVNVTDKLETQQIKDGAITNEKMAAGSVGNTNLQDGSVSNEKLEDGSITNEKLAENSITKDKLKDNTIGVEKLDPELRQTINAATGLPENLVETIQNVDDTLKDHQRQLDDKQSQIDDKQQQITANDEDISLLQTRSTQMEETIKSIAATGGASQATAVTYDNANSQLSAINIQSAVDELQGSKIDKTSILQESGKAEDKVMSQKAVSDKLSDLSYNTKNVDTYSSAKTITLSTGLSNKAINTNGVIEDSNAYNISTPIKLEAKQMIVVEAIANYASIICKIDSDTISENSKLTPLVVFYNNPKGDIAVYKYIAEEPCYVVISDRRNLSRTNVRIIDYPYMQKSITTTLEEAGTKMAAIITYGNKIDITVNKKETSKDVTVNIPENVAVAYKNKVDYFKKTASVTRTDVTVQILWAIINMDSFDVSLQNYSYVPNSKEAYLFGIDLAQSSVTSYNPAIFTFNGKPSLRTKNILHGQDILSSYLNDFYNSYVDTDNLLNVYSIMQKIELSNKLKGYYIDYNGKLVQYKTYSVSSTIQLKKGEMIIVSVSANNTTAIALCDTDDVSLDSKLTSVAYGDNSTVIREFSYSATNDCYVVISGATHTLKYAYKVPKNNKKLSLLKIKESLEQKIDERTTNDDSILYLNDKTIVGNNILQATRQYNKYPAQLSNKLCTLSVLTDIHGCQNNLQRYMDFTNEYVSYIDDMLCLGDTIMDSWVNTMDFFNNVKGSEKILLTIGNHDTCDRTQNPVVWHQYAGKQAYDRYFAPYIANWKVVQPENAATNGYCWYYKDYNTAKVRLIVIDCMYMFKDTEQAQLQWFTGVLTDAKEKGLSVVAAKHYPFNVVQDKDKNTFNSLDYSSYDGNSKSSMKGFLDAIETYISGGGEFICWLNGDSHYDFQGLITDYPNQYAIAFENAGASSTWNDSVRIVGTKSQDSFNFVTFDTNTKLIKVVRVGNNSDRYLRHKNYICYDYKNKKIITCE